MELLVGNREPGKELVKDASHMLAEWDQERVRAHARDPWRRVGRLAGPEPGPPQRWRQLSKQTSRIEIVVDEEVSKVWSSGVPTNTRSASSRLVASPSESMR